MNHRWRPVFKLNRFKKQSDTFMGMKVTGERCVFALWNLKVSLFLESKKKSIWGEIKGDQQIYNKLLWAQGKGVFRLNR